MKYTIDDFLVFNTADEVAEYISDNIDDDYYDEFIDECYGDIKIGTLSYSASYVLRNVDEIAYNVGFSDFTETLDIAYEVEGLSDGETIELYGFTISAEEDEEEEADDDDEEEDDDTDE